MLQSNTNLDGFVISDIHPEIRQGVCKCWEALSVESALATNSIIDVIDPMHSNNTATKVPDCNNPLRNCICSVSAVNAARIASNGILALIVNRLS